MSNVVVVYDDSNTVNSQIKSIIGKENFGEIIFKRESLRNRYINNIEKYDFTKYIYDIKNMDEINDLVDKVKKLPQSTKYVHIYSNFIIQNSDEFEIIFQKVKYIKQNIIVLAMGNSMLMFENGNEYMQYLKNIQNNKTIEDIKFSSVDADYLIDISNVDNFLRFISGGFDARFFNSVKGNEYTVTKTSTNKHKIKCEYNFYHLLPEMMKMWFVMPFNYVEKEDYASYSMERFHMTDLAIRWVHGAIDIDEFDKLLKKVFYFISNRDAKEISKKSYSEIESDLYITKLHKRIEELKNHNLYPKFASYIESGTKYSSIDEIISEYKSIYKKMHDGKDNYISVVGHGDLCFSNMLYDKHTNILKLIDPKGAIVEEDLWTNPYYDIAKLSHSICGRYDFFNSGLYDIKLNENLCFDIELEFDNSAYVDLFKKYLKENEYDYRMIRLYEASLFLSMLPLHMDYPQKVFGFLLNAINILGELKNV
jgi:hypothetical protein